MLIPNLVTIMQLVLSIEYSYSFNRFKNTQFTYYKALDSVSFKSWPVKRLTSYAIYVAGETMSIYIPRRVVNVSDIVNWKVINPRKDKLMFVHKNKPQIMINRKTIRPMKLKPGTNPLTGSIIVFSDNEALHVPTISNPNKPFPKWNYIELLYFDDEDEEVSVIRSLPRLKDDDWKFIKEWKMMDYIHFDDKLYLLIKRSIWNEKASNVTQEISIIRLCLDKGRELICSAIEIRYNRPEFQNNQITAAIFICLAYYVPEKIFLLITHKTLNQTLIHKRYFFEDFVSLFDKTGQECASGANNYTLMRYHLRSETRSCQKTTYKNCSSNENTVPSVELNFTKIWDYHFIFADGASELTGLEYAYDHTFNETHFCHQRIGYIQICIEIHKNFNYDNSIQNIEVFFFGYPFYWLFLGYNNVRLNESRWCGQYANTPLKCYKEDYGASKDDLQLHYYFNHRPFAFFHVTKDTNTVFRNFIDTGCANHLSCIHCMMYGHSMDCIWSDSSCRENEDNVTQTVNYCFKITSISPLIFNSSSSETLTIELDKPLEPGGANKEAPKEYLDIRAGPHNHCINITRNKAIIKCSMRLSESGKFKISVSLQNDRYTDTISLSAVSTQKVVIVVSKGRFWLLLLFLPLLFGSFTLITYSNYNKKHYNEFLEFKRSTRIMKIASKSMKLKKFSVALKSSPKTSPKGSPKKSTSEINVFKLPK